MTKNGWCSIDAHFHDRAGRVLLSVLPIKAAKNSFMTDYNLSEVWFPRTHDQKSLTLRWRSFSWGCRKGIANRFAYKGSQKLLYDWLQSIRGVISQDTWPKIVDAPLTLIFMMGKGGYCCLFCLQRRPKIPFWLTRTYQRCDCPERMTINRWCSVDAHFHHGAGRLLLSVLPIKAAKNSFVTDYNLSEVWFPRTDEQKSLTLCWRSFSWWGREGIANCFAYKGNRKFLYDWLQPIGGVISQYTWPKIVDALLTLIFMMGQGVYCCLFCLQRRPKTRLWLTRTYQRCDCPGRMTINCWRCIDAHFHHCAVRVLLSVLPIKADKNSFVTDYNQSEVWFPRTHDQKSLTLRWRSFCHGCIHNMQSFILAQSIIHFVLAGFLAFSFTFFLITTLFFNNT